MTPDRTPEIIAAYLAECTDLAPSAALARLTQRLPSLSVEELLATARRSKALGRTMNSLAHHLARAEEHARHRRAAGRQS